MATIGIVGNGPEELIPDLTAYKGKVDIWIGADRGAVTIMNHHLDIAHALGDFDSVTSSERRKIEMAAKHFSQFPAKKDKTDIEIALLKAFELNPKTIYLFGVTGGRLDHALINLQLLYTIAKKDIRGLIVDRQNIIELTKPDTHIVTYDNMYPYLSLIPFTQTVQCLTLSNFFYPLEKQDISWGETLCISNRLLSNSGTFSYEAGILLCIKSCDATSSALM